MALSLSNTLLQIKPPSHPLLSMKKGKGCALRNYGVQVTCKKKNIHPQIYYDAKVYCDGELVLTTGGTQKKYDVDVWSGNHPFYRGERTALVDDMDLLERYIRKFGDVPELTRMRPDVDPAKIPEELKSAGQGKNK